MATPSSLEKKLLIDFRERVGDILETDEHKQDSFLLRWIRARDHNLNRAEEMLRTSLLWRKENQVETLDFSNNNFFRKEFPVHFVGVDKLGQPVNYIQGKYWDFGKLNTSEKLDQFKLYSMYCFEEDLREIKKANEARDPNSYPVTQFTTILDWKGYSYMQVCNLKTVQNVLYGVSIMEAHYPEILHRCVCINCPSSFQVLLMLAKPFLAANTFKKILIYGSNRPEWENALKEIMNEDQVANVLELMN